MRLREEKLAGASGRLGSRCQDTVAYRHPAFGSKELGNRSLLGKRLFISMKCSPGSQKGRRRRTEVKETPCACLHVSIPPTQLLGARGTHPYVGLVAVQIAPGRTRTAIRNYYPGGTSQGYSVESLGEKTHILHFHAT